MEINEAFSAMPRVGATPDAHSCRDPWHELLHRPRS